MTATLAQTFENELRDLIIALVDDDLELLEERAELGRCRKEDLRRVIAEYGRKFEHPPDDFLTQVNFYELADGSGWSVDVILWDEGGRSDLTLQLDIKRDHQGHRFEITDLHVL